MNYSITSIKSLSDHLVLQVYIILNESFAITNYWKDCVWKSRFLFGYFIVLNSHNELMNLIATCEFSILYVFCRILVKRSKLLIHYRRYILKLWSLKGTPKRGPIFKIFWFFSISFSKWLWKCLVPYEFLMFEIYLVALVHANPQGVNICPKNPKPFPARASNFQNSSPNQPQNYADFFLQ